MLHLSLLWEKDGTPSGIIFQNSGNDSLDQLRLFMINASNDWMGRSDLPLYYRVSKKIWEELVLCSENEDSLKILEKEFKGLTLLTPPFGVMDEDSALEALKRLTQANLSVFLGTLSLKSKHISMLSYVRGCELDFAELGRDICANLNLKIKQANRQCFVSSMRSMPEVSDLFRLGVTTFTGNAIFERHFAAKTVKLDSSTVKTLNLLQMVYNQIEISEIEMEIKEDPVLSYKLLSLINSAGLRTQRTVGTVKDALIVLGYKSLGLWLSLLLLSSAQKNSENKALYIYMLFRAKLSSLIMQRHDVAQTEEAFVCALFSSLDAYLDAPLQDLVSKAQLPVHMKEAILLGKGVLGNCVKISKIHHQTPDAIEQYIKEQEISKEDFESYISEAWMYALTICPC